MNRARYAFALLELTTRDRTFARVLAVFSEAVGNVPQRLALVHEAHPDLRDDILEEECEMIENLLGAAFVVCQARITAVASHALRIAQPCENREIGIAPFPQTKNQMLDLGAPVRPGSVHSKVQVFDALANYFKHREEWQRSDWSRFPPPRAKETIAVIGALGLEPGCSGNLRRGATILGNTSYDRMDRFAHAIDEWSQRVIEAAKVEVGL